MLLLENMPFLSLSVDGTMLPKMHKSPTALSTLLSRIICFRCDDVAFEDVDFHTPFKLKVLQLRVVVFQTWWT